MEEIIAILDGIEKTYIKGLADLAVIRLQITLLQQTLEKINN